MSNVTPNMTPENKAPVWLVVLCIVTLFAGIVDRDLWTPDEPRDAAIALEMSRDGQIMVPRLAGEPFVEKPGLAFMASAGAVRLFGRLLGDVGAIRLLSALWGLGVLLFAWRIACRLYNQRTAILSSVMTAVMPGFVENFHWIRVDPALAFFVMGAVWCLVEAFLAARTRLLVLAGLFAAGAFWAKGIIGPLMIGWAWLGLLAPKVVVEWRRERRVRCWPGMHGMSLLLFLLGCGAWIVLFRVQGGPELWNEWFWRNQVGRLMGTTTDLGHIEPGAYSYYLEALSWYTLPWLPLILIWWVRRLTAWVRRSLVTPADGFVMIWSVGVVVMLTASVTKRELYILPLLPAFGWMAADLLQRPSPRWCNGLYTIWTGACLLVVAVLAVSPLWASRITALPDPARAVLAGFGWRHAVVLFCGAAGVYVIFFHRRLAPPARAAALSALLWISFWSLPARAIDAAKSMADEYRRFADQIPISARTRVAAWNFSETTRGCLYVYADSRFTRVLDEGRIFRILQKDDAEFDSVILDRVESVDDFIRMPHEILASAKPGPKGRERPLYWVRGMER